MRKSRNFIAARLCGGGLGRACPAEPLALAIGLSETLRQDNARRWA